MTTNTILCLTVNAIHHLALKMLFQPGNIKHKFKSFILVQLLVNPCLIKIKFNKNLIKRLIYLILLTAKILYRH